MPRTLPGRLLVALAALLVSGSPAFGLSHLWRINELFSTADGTVQFIELYECCGSKIETRMAGLEMESVANDAVWVFTHDLEEPTDNKYLLIATPRYLGIPGAPRPDYVMPEAFFDMLEDTIWYSQVRNYDSFTFGQGELPLDGLQSIHVTDYEDDLFETGPNSPTNFAGETGSIDLSAPRFDRGDCNDDGIFNIADPISALQWMFLGNVLDPPCKDACDANDDGVVELSDAVRALSSLFVSQEPLPPPAGVCGVDPTEDTLGCDVSAPCVGRR